MAFLILEDGTIFEGVPFGAKRDIIGEVVFNTGMTGYQEVLTDPSYLGQIVTMTYPLIGNYGVIPEDFESRKSFVKGYIVRDWCQEPSNFRNQGDLDTFLREQNVPGIYGIDTRALTKIVRESGVMNGIILSELPEDKSKVLSNSTESQKRLPIHLAAKEKCIFTPTRRNIRRRSFFWIWERKRRSAVSFR